MSNFSLIKKSLSVYEPALLLDDVFPMRVRSRVGMTLVVVSVLSVFGVLTSLFFPDFTLSQYRDVGIGVFFIAVALRLCLLLLSFFYNAYYFRDAESVLKEPRLESTRTFFTYEVARIVSHTDEKDVTFSFLTSEFGSYVLMRLGLKAEVVNEFLYSRKPVSSTLLSFPDKKRITGVEYAKAIYDADSLFAQFLFARTIQEKEFMGAVYWVQDSFTASKQRERWWSKDALGRIPGIGKSWSYGNIAVLENYSKELMYGVEPRDAGVMKEVEEVESVLARTSGANALIVSTEGAADMDVIYGLVGMIRSGVVLPPLEGKRVFVFDANALVEGYRERSSFETHFYQIMNEGMRAGNLILVFQDLPLFIQTFRSVGSDFTTIIEPYLASSRVQIIATSDQARFHEVVEAEPVLMNAFEVVHVAEKDESSLVTILEHMVPRIERKEGVLFTYQALQAIAESTARFFSESEPLDKARDLIIEVPALVHADGRRWITKEDVARLVESKTGVPQEGTIASSEKDKLIHLEELLHGRVIGQDEAINTIANAMRRARAGLRNQKRPIGSFLFLGPTGVGKTETAKALAEIFFGATAPMLRLDMSEYSGYDAVQRLIGSSGDDHAGVLATMLRDQKYGVLLLDEFEKTTPEVMNLFLQILDEGFFSDMRGKKVSARNVIVIATSNAGSDLIFTAVEEGKDLSGEKSALIDHVIERGQFKPELLNRFDGVILFHPLESKQLENIASLLVDKLSVQLKEQGIRLSVTKDLIAFLAREGTDKKFGARPMNRVLQERVEKLLADKIIRGDIAKGATVEFVTSTTAPGELEVRAVSA